MNDKPETTIQKHEILTVGDLRKALQGAPDNRRLHCQVVATNGQVFYTNITASPTAWGGNTSIACISMSHPNLNGLVTEHEFSKEKIE